MIGSSIDLLVVVKIFTSNIHFFGRCAAGFVVSLVVVE